MEQGVPGFPAGIEDRVREAGFAQMFAEPLEDVELQGVSREYRGPCRPGAGAYARLIPSSARNKHGQPGTHPAAPFPMRAGKDRLD